MEILLGISLTINLIVVGLGIICYLYYKKVNKSRKEIENLMNVFGKENIVDEEQAQDFFNN